MPRKAEIPNIKSAVFNYNGDKTAFDFFMESLIRAYLDSDSMPKSDEDDSVGKIEISEKTA